MMSQSTTSIFASPDVFVPKSGPTLRRATPHSQLVVCDAAGEVLQSWNLILPKSTLGSASSNSICVSLPGIAPMHALLVSGQKQSFVRTLAGKLTQDGIAASELLLSDDNNYFELAGFRFTLNRISAAKQQSERQAAQRMKFALSRPLSTATTVEPLVRPDQPEEKFASARVMDREGEHAIEHR